MKTVIYIHIPFCPTGCKFCHFYLESHKKSWYIDILDREYQLRFPDQVMEVDTIHIGWGTPNILSLWELSELFAFIHRRFRWYQELSIELHPALLSFEQLDLLFESGVNRLSFGIQTLDPEVLAHHSRVDAKYSQLGEYIEYAQTLGFDKINFDLIFDLIGDSKENIEKSLDFIKKYQPTSVYYYKLRTFTEFLKKKYIPNPRRSLMFYLKIRNFFSHTHYTRLNNSVYFDKNKLKDKPAFLYDEYIYSHKRHLIGFWVAATSDTDNLYQKNTIKYEAYVERVTSGISPVDLEFSLDPDTYRIARFYLFFLQNSEFPLEKFTNLYGSSPLLESRILLLQELKFLTYQEGSIKLTETWHYHLDDQVWDILFEWKMSELELLKKL